MKWSIALPLLALAACTDKTETDASADPAAPPVAEAEPAAPADDKDAVTAFLRAQLADDLGDTDIDVATGRADLDGDGVEEVLAYPMGPMVCGSGGCDLYVLSPAGSSYRILGQLSVSRLPIYKLAPGADGWAELGVTVAGGGMEQTVMAVPHGADGYASNPTVAPARAVDPGDAPVIIADPYAQETPETP